MNSKTKINSMKISNFLISPAGVSVTLVSKNQITLQSLLILRNNRLFGAVFALKF